MAVQYKNFVEGTLNAAISGTGNQDITVNWATNATVPTGLSVSNYMLFVIDPEGANGAPEIVRATSITGSGPYTLALTGRGEGSSSARTHADASKIVAAVTAEQIDNFAAKDGTTFTGNVTVGVDGTGHDVQFYGDSASHWMLWDQSEDALILTQDSGIFFYDKGGEVIQAASDGHLNIDAGTTLDLTAPTIDLNASTEVNIDGDVDLNGALDISGTAGISNLQITFAEGYKIYADNTTTGGGAANSRIWFEAPDNGEMVLGPRTGEHELHNMRLRATTIAAEGAINVTGLLTANGGLTIQDGDTFTFDTEALTDCIDSGETFTRSDTALATTGAIVDNFLQYDVDGGADQGATLYIQASTPYADGAGGGVKGDIWIDT